MLPVLCANSGWNTFAYVYGRRIYRSCSSTSQYHSLSKAILGSKGRPKGKGVADWVRWYATRQSR
jgi:hypothetical protein